VTELVAPATAAAARVEEPENQAELDALATADIGSDHRELDAEAEPAAPPAEDAPALDTAAAALPPAPPPALPDVPDAEEVPLSPPQPDDPGVGPDEGDTDERGQRRFRLV
jgi:hypothetical protein